MSSGIAPPETPEQLEAAVRRLARASVTVIGDAMLDRYIYGDAGRISPEAPIPVLAITREVALPGGAGNVVRNLTALGAAVAFVAVVGDDQAGSDLTALIGGQPNVEPWLLVQGSRATTMKTRYVAQGQQLLRADREDTGPIHPKLAERLVRIARDALAATSVTVLSDYGKGTLGGDLPAQLIAAAHQAGRRVIVDPKGDDFASYAGADILTPNRGALGRATGIDVSTDSGIIRAAEALRTAHGFGAVLVTRAEHGMTLVDEAGFWHLPAEATEVFDVSGAGDTVVAALAAGIAVGLELRLAARLASLAAAIVVGKIGTAVARQSDLLAALSPDGAALRKIIAHEPAAEQVARWRRKGWRIGFAYGAFDPLHAGHRHLLEQARGVCDRLIVALPSDAALRRRKEPPHAIQPEAARAAEIASLPAVDVVCLYAEDSPAALIGALRPEILVTGADLLPEEQADRAAILAAELASQIRDWDGEAVSAAALTDNAAEKITRLRG